MRPSTVRTSSSYGRAACPAIAESASRLSGGTTMPAQALGCRSRTTRWAASSRVAQPSQRVGASGPSSSRRSQRAARSASAGLVTPRWYESLSATKDSTVGWRRHPAAAVQPRLRRAPGQSRPARRLRGEGLSATPTDVLVAACACSATGSGEESRIFLGRRRRQRALRRDHRGERVHDGPGAGEVVVPAFQRGQIERARWPRSPPRCSGWRAEGGRHLRPPARRRLHAVPAAGRATGGAVTRRYLGCRWPGTSGTRPARCCPTPTPTSRPPGTRSRRCRSRSARCVMLVAAMVALFAHRLGARPGRLVVFPVLSVNVVYSRRWRRG